MKRGVLMATVACLTACQPPQANTPPDAPEAWQTIETKDGVTVSFLPSSLRSTTESTVAWIRAQHDVLHETELRGQAVRYDRELDYWSIDCGTLKFSVDKREFYRGTTKVDEWPSEAIEMLHVEKELPTPGTKAYRVVIAVCKAARKA